MKKIIYLLAGVLLVLAGTFEAKAQLEPFKMEDTSGFIQDLYLIKNKYRNLSFSGYTQVQYQWADTAGAQTYNGGNFEPASNNRFMMRRSRIRADYEVRNKAGFLRHYSAFQIDATERGVVLRDMFGRIYENKWNVMVLTVGMFNRPVGFEANYSSSFRETPERGRMSQILMRNERDLGAMLSFEPQDKKNKFYYLKADLGVFNGQGTLGTSDFDSHKDVIGRVALRRYNVTRNVAVSGGVSYLYGGLRNSVPQIGQTQMGSDGVQYMVLDSSKANIEKIAPRRYAGVDAQVVINSSLGRTELRGEYLTGQQPGYWRNSTTAVSIPTEPVYWRKFNGAYLYFLHTIKEKHQLVVKYDWYDPNTKVSGKEISLARGFNTGDIRYNTLGVGYVYYWNPNVKFMLYVENPVNENVDIPGYDHDLKDRTYTIRTQFRF
jgi:hypothetical protein